jgi:GTP pyrophosphokinase
MLSVGDVVEVVTSQNAKGPSWDWSKIVKSPSARVKIRQFFKREMKDENIKTGRSMLELEAKKRGFNFSELLTDESFLVLSSKMSFNSQDEMFASVGFGAVSVGQVVVKLVDYYRRRLPKQEPVARFGTAKNHKGSIIVKGMDNILVRFAGCCNPVPGDDIVGFISRGHGVTVHRRDCPNLTNVEEDRLIEVKWADRETDAFNSSIKVIGKTQTDILTTVASIVSMLKLEIVSTNGRTDTKNNQVIVDFNIRLNSKYELDTLINKLREDKKIIDVFRTAT